MKESYSISVPVSGAATLTMKLGEIAIEPMPEDITNLLEFLNDRSRIGTFALRLRKPFIGSGMFEGVKTEHIVVDVEARIVSFALITSGLQQFTYGRKDLTLYLRECNKIIQNTPLRTDIVTSNFNIVKKDK